MGRPQLDLGTHGVITVVQRGETWRASCQVRDSDGKVRPLERNRPTKADAARALNIAIRDRKNGSGRVGGSGELSGQSTIRELMAEFWSWKTTHARMAEGTRSSYHDIITRIIVPGLGDVRLWEATTGRLDSWYRAERLRRRAQADLAKTLLNQAFKFAAQRDAVPRNPVADLSKPRDEPTTPRALTDDELEILRRGVRSMRQNTWLADLFEIQYGLGLRIGEALALTADDIHVLEEGQITVLIAATIITPKGKRPFRQKHTKDGPNGRRRLTPPTWVAAILLERARRAENSQLLFASRNDTILDPHNVRESWRNIRNSIGLDWVSPHHLRKTAATRVAAMFGIETASTFLGHSSKAVTQKYYIHPSEHHAPDVSAAFE